MEHKSPREYQPHVWRNNGRHRPPTYDGIPGAINEEVKPGAIKQSADEVHEFFHYFCNGVLTVDTPNEMVRYWSRSEHREIFDRPNAAFVLVNNFLIVADRYLTEGAVEGFNHDCLKCASRIFVNTFFVMQCLDKFTPFSEVIDKFSSSGSIDEWLSWFPILRKGYQTSKNRPDMLENIDLALKSMEDVEKLSGGWPGGCLRLFSGTQLGVSFVTSGSPCEKTEYAISDSNNLKWLFRAYSKDRSEQLKSLRFTFEGRQLFLSLAGKKTAAELGLKDGSIISVSRVQHPSASAKAAKTTKAEKPKGNSLKKKRKGRRKKKASTHSHSYSVLSEEEKLKQQHSKAISLVFEECSDRFKSIRERLNAMNLERMQPKSKTRQLDDSIPVDQSLVHTPPAQDVGKAGKSCFLVKVGEVTNLYKTCKSSASRNSQPRHKITRIDLHGLTKADALTRLDESLPEWVDRAMKGEYPWIIPVEIICGGGNQILAEAVSSWIQRNPQVANAPKSSFD